MSTADGGTSDLLEAALDLIARDGWSAYNALALARETGAGLAETCLQLGDGAAVLGAMGHRADAAMIDLTAGELLELTPKERLFELLMRRFDALRVARPALRRLGRERVPEAWLGALGNLHRAMRLTGEAAGLAMRGPRGIVLRAALARAYLKTGRVWLDDEDADQSATLAELDKQLGRIEDLLPRDRHASETAAG